MSQRAKEYIQLEERERARNQNFLNLYQDTANYVYPLEDQITNIQTPGNRPKTIDLVDTTAIFEAQNMASNLSATLFPPGQISFNYEASDRALSEDEESNFWLSGLTEAAHEQVFGPHFLPPFNETLLSWLVFGEGDIYAERGTGKSMNFKDYPAGSFHYQEDVNGKPDQFIERFRWTARQCKEKWADGIGQTIAKAAEKPETENNLFWIVHVTRPRKTRNPNLIDSANMPYEDVFVGVDDKKIMFEGGFQEFPHHIGRYAKSSKENRGRGVGVFVLPQARALNSIKRDLIECGNRHNRPPLEVSGDVDGEVNLNPGAINWTSERNSINAISGSLGNYPISREILESEREEIRKAFLSDVFNQLQNLQGDRRTTLEISERLNEGLRRLSSPVARLISEILTPLLTRVALIMVRNGMYPEPPDVLQGKKFKVEYSNPLILALKRNQANAFVQWATVISEMEAVFPGVKDNVNADKAVRDIGMAFGVDATHIQPTEKRDDAREARAEQLAQQQQMEAAQLAAGAYSQTTKAPEDGSAAADVQEALGAA